jgi:hypothetical protein
LDGEESREEARLTGRSLAAGSQDETACSHPRNVAGDTLPERALAKVGWRDRR